eukprot:TRINITY_DN16807_c0_g1_i1.p1 TRINITY_DN16807_c0_g1~~TRINITY_DN16807_c0_g1_i1.p1  ORF type:complete len:668 (+),score=149.15 TRINITY_DN16807_c0_g1_i1:871-2874(+)
MPLEFETLANVCMRAEPSPACCPGRLVVRGAAVQGYPGAHSWLEVSGGGFLPMSSSALEASRERPQDFLQLRGALEATVRHTFSEAVLVEWQALPTTPAARVEYRLEWSGVHDEALRGSVTVNKRCCAQVRCLPPATALRLRVVAKVFALLPSDDVNQHEDGASSRSWQDQRLLGRWLYGAKPSEYHITRRFGSSLVFVGPHATGGTVTGVLEQEGHWLVAELASADGHVVGSIRLFYDEQEDAIISNFKNVTSVDWGKDNLAKKAGDADLLTLLPGQWLQVCTDAPITDKEEEELCFDPLCNRRGKCSSCSCTVFIMTDDPTIQELDKIPCRRCGCPVTHHAKMGKFRAKGQGNEAEEQVHGASFKQSGRQSPMDAIQSRRWNPEEVPAHEEPVTFILRQMELAKNLYEVLGTAPSSSAHEIRQAYRAISLRVHPDKINSGAASLEVGTLAEDAFKLATSAYEVLNDEVERRAYDRKLLSEWLKMQPPPKPKPKPKPQPMRVQPTQSSSFQAQAEHDEDSQGTQGVSNAEEFFRNPSIGTFMNSPYYGEDGVFGTSGTIKENATGGFSFELPGGGGIHIGDGAGYARLKHLETEMAKTGHIAPHLWSQMGLLPQPPASSSSVNKGPAWAGAEAHSKATLAANMRPMGSMGAGVNPAPRFQKGANDS